MRPDWDREHQYLFNVQKLVLKPVSRHPTWCRTCSRPFGCPCDCNRVRRVFLGSECRYPMFCRCIGELIGPGRMMPMRLLNYRNRCSCRRKPGPKRLSQRKGIKNMKKMIFEQKRTSTEEFGGPREVNDDTDVTTIKKLNVNHRRPKKNREKRFAAEQSVNAIDTRRNRGIDNSGNSQISIVEHTKNNTNHLENEHFPNSEVVNRNEDRQEVLRSAGDGQNVESNEDAEIRLLIDEQRSVNDLLLSGIGKLDKIGSSIRELSDDIHADNEELKKNIEAKRGTRQKNKDGKKSKKHSNGTPRQLLANASDNNIITGLVVNGKPKNEPNKENTDVRKKGNGGNASNEECDSELKLSPSGRLYSKNANAKRGDNKGAVIRKLLLTDNQQGDTDGRKSHSLMGRRAISQITHHANTAPNDIRPTRSLPDHPELQDTPSKIEQRQRSMSRLTKERGKSLETNKPRRRDDKSRKTIDGISRKSVDFDAAVSIRGSASTVHDGEMSDEAKIKKGNSKKDKPKDKSNLEKRGSNTSIRETADPIRDSVMSEEKKDGKSNSKKDKSTDKANPEKRGSTGSAGKQKKKMEKRDSTGSTGKKKKSDSSGSISEGGKKKSKKGKKSKVANDANDQRSLGQSDVGTITSLQETSKDPSQESDNYLVDSVNMPIAVDDEKDMSMQAEGFKLYDMGDQSFSLNFQLEENQRMREKTNENEKKREMIRINILQSYKKMTREFNEEKMKNSLFSAACLTPLGEFMPVDKRQIYIYNAAREKHDTASSSKYFDVAVTNTKKLNSIPEKVLAITDGGVHCEVTTTTDTESSSSPVDTAVAKRFFSGQRCHSYNYPIVPTPPVCKTHYYHQFHHCNIPIHVFMPTLRYHHSPQLEHDGCQGNSIHALYRYCMKHENVSGHTASVNLTENECFTASGLRKDITTTPETADELMYSTSDTKANLTATKMTYCRKALQNIGCRLKRIPIMKENTKADHLKGNLEHADYCYFPIHREPVIRQCEVQNLGHSSAHSPTHTATHSFWSTPYSKLNMAEKRKAAFASVEKPENIQLLDNSTQVPSFNDTRGEGIANGEKTLKPQRKVMICSTEEMFQRMAQAHEAVLELANQRWLPDSEMVQYPHHNVGTDSPTPTPAPSQRSSAVISTESIPKLEVNDVCTQANTFKESYMGAQRNTPDMSNQSCVGDGYTDPHLMIQREYAFADVLNASENVQDTVTERATQSPVSDQDVLPPRITENASAIRRDNIGHNRSREIANIIHQPNPVCEINDRGMEQQYSEMILEANITTLKTNSNLNEKTVKTEGYNRVQNSEATAKAGPFAVRDAQFDVTVDTFVEQGGPVTLEPGHNPLGRVVIEINLQVSEDNAVKQTETDDVNNKMLMQKMRDKITN